MRTDFTGAKRLAGNTLWLLEKRGPLSLSSNGTLLINCTFSDLMVLLARRVVAAESGSSQATKSAAAETVIKQFVTQQLLTDRTFGGVTVPGWQDFITMESDSGRGATEAASAAWADVLSACQAVAQASMVDGTYLAFDFEVLDTLAYQFCVYDGQRGVDRSPGSAKPLTVSANAGQILEHNYTEDYSAAGSALFATGQSVAGAQLNAYVVNPAIEYMGPFSHVERYGMGLSTGSAAKLTTHAKQQLRSDRPTIEVTATLAQSESFILGRDFDFGDYLTIQAGNIELPGYLEVMVVTVNSTGQETIQVTLRAELVDPSTGAVVPT
jgi:hypothetical protein